MSKTVVRVVCIVMAVMMLLGIVAAQQVATHQLSDSRDSIMGVSSNEELTNMIKFQNAYNAASRYITACNDMLENLLSNLA